jgi:hypothetical protein
MTRASLHFTAISWSASCLTTSSGNSCVRRNRVGLGTPFLRGNETMCGFIEQATKEFMSSAATASPNCLQLSIHINVKSRAFVHRSWTGHNNSINNSLDLPKPIYQSVMLLRAAGIVPDERDDTGVDRSPCKEETGIGCNFFDDFLE